MIKYKGLAPYRGPIAPFLATYGSAIAAGAAVVGAATQMKAAKEAKKAGEANARLAEQQATEEKRRLGIQQKADQSTLLARAGAGGAKLSSGSVLSVLNEQVSEAQKEQDWLTQKGGLTASAARTQGAQASASLMGGAMGSLGSAASAFK